MLGKPTSYSPLGGAHIECSHALLLNFYCHYHLSLYQSSPSFGLFDVSFFGHLVSFCHSHVSFCDFHVSLCRSLASFYHSCMSIFHSLVSVCHSRGSFDHKAKLLCYRDQLFHGLSPSLMLFWNYVALYQDISRIHPTLISNWPTSFGDNEV